MQVYTRDVKALLERARAQFGDRTGQVYGRAGTVAFMDAMIQDIAEKTGRSITRSSLYKGLFIRLKSHRTEVIGVSHDNLNTLSHYVYGKDYLDRYDPYLDREDLLPDYPEDRPRFPATPLVQIHGLGFSNLWIKDEARSPGGTITDRKALVIYRYYKEQMERDLWEGKPISHKRPSMLSSGFGALAIQRRLSAHGFPDLRVLIDKRTPSKLKDDLHAAGAMLYEHDLTQIRKRPFGTKELLALTKNEGGLDLTFGLEMEVLRPQFYAWWCYEILAQSPDAILVPLGSSELLKGLLDTHLFEWRAKLPSRRYFGNKQLLAKCRFIGVKSAPRSRRRSIDGLHGIHSYLDEEKVDELLKRPGVDKRSHIGLFQHDGRTLNQARRITRGHGIDTTDNALGPLVYFLQNKHLFQPDEYIIVVNAGSVGGKQPARKKRKNVLKTRSFRATPK